MSDAGGTEPIRASVRGLTWPLRVDERGGLALADPAEDIDRSIWLVIGTAPGQRRMRPEFGCRVWNLLTGPIDERLYHVGAESVRAAITRWEPRVSVEEVHVERDDVVTDDGVAVTRLSVTVSYLNLSSQERHTVGYERWLRPDSVQAKLTRSGGEHADRWIGRLAAGRGDL